MLKVNDCDLIKLLELQMSEHEFILVEIISLHDSIIIKDIT